MDTVPGIGIYAEKCYNITIDGCTVTNAGNGGIQFNGTLDPATRIRDSVIQNCTVTGNINTRNDGIVTHEGTPYNGTLLAGANFIIRNNTSTNNFEQGFHITAGSNVLVEGNTTSGNKQGALTIAHSAREVTVRYHTFMDDKKTNSIKGQNITIEYSTFILSSMDTNALFATYGVPAAFPQDLPT